MARLGPGLVAEAASQRQRLDIMLQESLLPLSRLLEYLTVHTPGAAILFASRPFTRRDL